MTKSELADRYGITTRTLSNWISLLVSNDKLGFDKRYYTSFGRGVLPPLVYKPIIEALEGKQDEKTGNNEKQAETTGK